MNCEQIQPLLEAHHDGELDAANTLAIEHHLADCPQCFARLRNLGDLRTRLGNDALRYRAPEGLKGKIRAAVESAAKAEQPATPTRVFWARHGWSAAAAALVAAFVLVQVHPGRQDDVLLAELTSSHVRSLMVNHLTDVPSSDQHTVKPWFDGKLDFAPPVKELRDSGFPLVGGRLDYIAGRPVAALIYARQKHFINLFIWPSAPGVSDPSASARNGYHLVHWTNRGMTFWAVSDLNEKELMDFAGLWPAEP